MTLEEDGSAEKAEVFASGWLDGLTGTCIGRPVDVAVAKDGALFCCCCMVPVWPPGSAVPPDAPNLASQRVL